MSLENTEQQIRKSREAAAERARESRETKEGGEMDEQAKAAAAMERAEFLVKEVQSSNKQIKNIVIHMQQVMQAIKALRQQLQLVSDDDAQASSVLQDTKTIEILKSKIAGHKDELIKMKDELIDAQIDQIKQEEEMSYSEEQLRAHATRMVEEILALVEHD